MPTYLPPHLSVSCLCLVSECPHGTRSQSPSFVEISAVCFDAPDPTRVPHAWGCHVLPAGAVSDFPGLRDSHRARARSFEDRPSMHTCLATSPGSQQCFTPAQVLQEPTTPTALCPPAGRPAPPAPMSSAGQTPLSWGPSGDPPSCSHPVGGPPSVSALGPPGRVAELSAAWKLGAWILTASPGVQSSGCGLSYLSFCRPSGCSQPMLPRAVCFQCRPVLSEPQTGGRGV